MTPDARAGADFARRARYDAGIMPGPTTAAFANPAFALLAQADDPTAPGEPAPAQTAPVAEAHEGLADTFLHLSLRQWIEIGAITLLAIVAAWVARLAARALMRAWLRRRGGSGADSNIRAAAAPFALIGAGAAAFVSLRWSTLPTGAISAIALGARIALVVGAVWFGFRLVNVILDIVRARLPVHDPRLDDLLLPMLRVGLKIVVAALGVFYIARSLNIDILPLITGLGIGGLAVAFAAKDTIENLFGSVAVVLDEAFKVGDWVIVEGHQGVVETIGFRSTRVRGFDDGLIIIPNAMLVRSVVTNMGERRFRRFQQTLGLTYDTPADKVREFCKRVWSLAEKHPKVQKETIMVAFQGFGASALEVYFRVFLDAKIYNEDMALRHEFCEAIMRTAEEIGVEFAFPTQTLHVASMPPMEPQRTDRD